MADDGEAGEVETTHSKDELFFSAKSGLPQLEEELTKHGVQEAELGNVKKEEETVAIEESFEQSGQVQKIDAIQDIKPIEETMENTTASKIAPKEEDDGLMDPYEVLKHDPKTFMDEERAKDQGKSSGNENPPQTQAERSRPQRSSVCCCNLQ